MNLGELRSLTRTYINEPFAAFWTDAELNNFENVGNRKYHAKIKNLSRNHFTTRMTFNTTVNQEYYQLPASLKDLRLVSIVESDGKETFLSKAYWPNPDVWTEPTLLSLSLSSDMKPQQYWQVGHSLRFVPKPSSVLTIRLYFEARLAAMSNDADLPSIDEDYHDLIAKWAAVEACIKNEKRRQEILELINIRELELLQDVYHRVNPPVGEVEGYLEGIYP